MDIAVLEGILFVVGDEGIDIKEISELLDIDTNQVQVLIDELKNEYQKENRGISLEVLGGKYKLTTKKIHSKYYERMVLEENKKELTQSALETLAIIAYNEPITRSLIDEIRGVSTSYIVRKLLLRNLIKELGRSDLPGRPIMYGTTDKFLDYFGLKDKNELPKISIEKNEDDIEIDLFESRYRE